MSQLKSSRGISLELFRVKLKQVLRMPHSILPGFVAFGAFPSLLFLL